MQDDKTDRADRADKGAAGQGLRKRDADNEVKLTVVHKHLVVVHESRKLGFVAHKHVCMVRQAGATMSTQGVVSGGQTTASSTTREGADRNGKVISPGTRFISQSCPSLSVALPTFNACPISVPRNQKRGGGE